MCVQWLCTSPNARELKSEPHGKRLKDLNIGSPSTTSPRHMKSQLADFIGCSEHPVIFLVSHFFLFISIIFKSFKIFRKVERRVQITPIYPVFIFPTVKFFPMFALSFSPSPSSLSPSLGLALPLSLSPHPFSPFFFLNIFKVNCRYAPKCFRVFNPKNKVNAYITTVQF